ncbi:hypothetical protein EZV73_00140 [Acidaminobacter sp. JC074]|uniref:hypothetical protein n=1 Tax=Acidaminobacter sp. JC074 TaxID=2530199 RepID=UPI001F0D906F|nr:hypothetical protein [Acidaminobacter sp. JC074]MCH4885947.1 hypothetical protein [Acidaminobacter sp. JC074]
MLDMIRDFFLYTEIGSLTIRYLLAVYPLVLIYFIYTKVTKKRFRRFLWVIVGLSALIHVSYFMPYSLDIDKEHVKKIHFSLENGPVLVEDEETLNKMINHLNNMQIRNSIHRPSIMGKMRFDLQRGFRLTYLDDDLLGHIIFTRYYDQSDFDSYKIYVRITNEEADGYLVHIKDCEVVMEELLQWIE